MPRDTHSLNSRDGRLGREKSQLKENCESFRELEYCCLVEQIETISMQCTVVVQISTDKNLYFLIAILNALLHSHSQKRAAWDVLEVYQLYRQEVSEA